MPFINFLVFFVTEPVGYFSQDEDEEGGQGSGTGDDKDFYIEKLRRVHQEFVQKSDDYEKIHEQFVQSEQVSKKPLSTQLCSCLK